MIRFVRTIPPCFLCSFYGHCSQIPKSRRTVWLTWSIMVGKHSGGNMGHWSHGVCHQKAERKDCWHSINSLLLSPLYSVWVTSPWDGATCAHGIVFPAQVSLSGNPRTDVTEVCLLSGLSQIHRQWRITTTVCVMFFEVPPWILNGSRDAQPAWEVWGGVVSSLSGSGLAPGTQL